jgi:transposase
VTAGRRSAARPCRGRHSCQTSGHWGRGCRALQCHYGIGWLCAVIIWAEIGDARRFSSSDRLVRFAGLDVTVYSSDGKCSPGHLSRQGSPGLRWAAGSAADQ